MWMHQNNPQQMPVIEGLTSDEIKNNTNQYTKENSNSNSREMCVICQDGYNEDPETSKIKACGHEFHTKCLNLGLSQKRTCPYCRAEVVAGNG